MRFIVHNSNLIVEINLVTRLLCPRDVNPPCGTFVLVEQFVDAGQVSQGVDESSSQFLALDSQVSGL